MLNNSERFVVVQHTQQESEMHMSVFKPYTMIDGTVVDKPTVVEPKDPAKVQDEARNFLMEAMAGLRFGHTSKNDIKIPDVVREQRRQDAIEWGESFYDKFIEKKKEFLTFDGYCDTFCVELYWPEKHVIETCYYIAEDLDIYDGAMPSTDGFGYGVKMLYAFDENAWFRTIKFLGTKYVMLTRYGAIYEILGDDYITSDYNHRIVVNNNTDTIYIRVDKISVPSGCQPVRVL